MAERECHGKSADINPWSEIVLRDLKVQSTNLAPLVTAKEVRIKGSLFNFLGGNYRVEEALVESPTVQIVRNPDGTSNLDPVTRAWKRNAKRRKEGANASRPVEADIRRITVSDATFRKVINQRVGTGDLLELTNIDLKISRVQNGGSGKAEFSCVIRDENNPPAPAMYGLLRAGMDGSFDFTLKPDLTPGSVLGDAHLDISQAAGSFSDFAKLDGTLHCDASASEFKSVTLSFEKQGSRLGELRATGPYDAEKAEGRLSVELLSVDRQVLDLFGARYGIDFGSTTISSTNEIQISEAGSAIGAAGQLWASKLQLSRTNESTPPINLRADYNVSVNKAEKMALLRTLNVSGTEDGRPLLRGELTSPMTLAWGNATNAVGDSSLNLTISRLNIAQWNTFLGNLASVGTVDLDLKLLSQQGGRELTFDATNRIENLSTQIGGQPLTDTTVLLLARGRASDLKLFNLRDYTLQLIQSNQTALALSGSGVYDRTNSNVDLQVSLKASLPRALPLLNRADLTAFSGTAELDGRVTHTREGQTVSGNLSLSKFTGKFGRSEFRNFGATMGLEVEKTPVQIAFHRVAGQLTGGRNSGGDFDFSGTYSLNRGPSQLELTFSNFNQDGLRPFLEPLFAYRSLVSISMNGTVSAEINPKSNSTVRADIVVTNLVVSDSMQEALTEPLEARLNLEAGIAKGIADVRRLQVNLTPTIRATNQFQLEGRLDVSRTNTVQGDLRLSADSLDLTSYYDLFHATNKIPVKPVSRGRNKGQNRVLRPPPAAERGTNHLPFANFTLAAKVNELYLREIAASNFQATVKLDGGRVLLKPFQFTLGGSPIAASADVDMSVPGWKCALTMNGTNAPFAPLWNTFLPQYKGEVGGSLTAYGNINGVGASGETLQKSLVGNLHISVTNLNLYVPTIHNRALLNVVGVVANVPDLIQNPLSALSLAIKVGKLSGGMSGELDKNPIEVIDADASAGGGRVLLKRGFMRSAVFEASTTNGSITLAPALTNSAINIPIRLALSTTVAPRVPLLNVMNTQTNENYVSLPNFFSETGTIGNPQNSINVVVLTTSTIQRASTGTAGGTNSNIVQPPPSIGQLLNGAANTNSVPTNRPVINGVSSRFITPTGK